MQWDPFLRAPYLQHPVPVPPGSRVQEVVGARLVLPADVAVHQRAHTQHVAQYLRQGPGAVGGRLVLEDDVGVPASKGEELQESGVP